MSSEKLVRRVHLEVKRALEEVGFSRGKKLVAAVSGGPDSLAMLHALFHLGEELELELHGAHLDHGLRGTASASDARFASMTFAKLGIGASVERRDVSAHRRERRVSVEQAARDVRYSFLAQVAIEQGADAIALGHTADDQAETVLMHVIRGSGLQGLRGMELMVRRIIGDVEVVLLRPLLQVSGAETRDYCAAMGLRPRDDETNRSPEIVRNRLRLDLIPHLEEYNPAVRDALVRLSRNAAQTVRYLESGLDDVWTDAVDVGEALVSIERGVFLWLEPALQSHLLRRAVVEVKGDVEDLQQVHVDQMLKLMEGPPGRSLDLPGGVVMTVSYDHALLAKKGQDLGPLPVFDGVHELTVPGETEIGDWSVKASVTQPSSLYLRSARRHGLEIGPAPGPEGGTVVLSQRSLGVGLVVRAREPGDRFQPLGMSQTKKLQDFMVDAKIPRHLRDRIPLVVTDRGVAWVAGWRVAEWAKVTEPGERCLELRFVRWPKHSPQTSPGQVAPDGP